MSNLYVRSDAGQLGALAELLADGKLSLPVAEGASLDDAGPALDRVIGSGTPQGAVVIRALGG